MGDELLLPSDTLKPSNTFDDVDFAVIANEQDNATFGEEDKIRLETASQIAKWIVGILAIFIFVALLLGCCPKSWGLYSPGEIVKEVGSYLAPIITLVLGFFFGKSS